MKMDSHQVDRGLPRSPMKPPLPPKPQYYPKTPPRQIWSNSKLSVEKVSSMSTEEDKLDEKILSEALFVSRTTSGSYSSSISHSTTKSYSTVDKSHIQRQLEDNFFSCDSSFNISLDSSHLSLTSTESFRESFRIDEHRSSESLTESGVHSFIHDIHSTTDVHDTPEIIDNADHLFLDDQSVDTPDKSDSYSLFYDSTIDDSTSSSFQNCNNSSLSDDNDIKLSHKENKVYLIARELTTSEQEYVDALKLLLIDFKAFVDMYGVAQNVTVIPQGELDKVFNTLPQLLHLNEDLLNDLKSRIDNWQENKRIADVIARKGPFLKLYATYMKDFESQCNYLDECSNKYPKFSKALKEFEMSPACKKLTLKHYMLKPVQRIPHYRLLLENYLKHLDGDTVEYRDTEVALNIVKDVLHHANSSLKLAKNFWRLLEIQTNLGHYEIIKPGRVLVKEGELKKLSRKDIQSRFIILLSDCLLYTISSSSTIGLKVKYELPLFGMKVYTQPGVGTDFSIITKTRSFTLRARSDNERKEWVQVICETICDNITRQQTFANKSSNTLNSSCFDSFTLGRQAPVWVQDKSTTMCQICTAEFTVTFRRHHCRCCGKVVCGDCSSNKAPLQFLKFQAVRVCEECYQYLLEEFQNPEAKISELIKLAHPDQEFETLFHSIKSSFKKMDSIKKTKKFIPQRLKEVRANDHGSSMSGWLYRKNKKEWKRLWFVLKDQVLYMYKASHDVVAYDSLPVLGYVVDRPDEVEELDTNLTFRLTHAGQMPVIFSAPDKQSADLWVAALSEATVLK